MPADIIINTDNDIVNWQGYEIHFIMTPGHSYGSMCIDIGGSLYTGDTIMPFDPYFNGRDSKEEDWERSIEKILSCYSPETIIMPGHGETLNFDNWILKYYRTK